MHSRRRRWAWLVGVGLVASLARAADGSPEIELHLGATVEHVDFREYAVTGEQLVRESGVLPGAVAGIGQALDRWRWSAELSVADGTVSYDGRTQVGAPLATRTDEAIARLRARALHVIDDEGRFAAGIGLGYWRWQRHIRGRGGVSGLDERYTAAEVSLDTRVSVLRTETNSVDLDLQLAWPIRPEVKVDFGGRYDPQTLALGPRLAARVSIPVSWAVGPGSRVVVAPGFDAWGFGRSASETLYRDGAPAGVVYQPQGKGYSADLKLVWVQSF